MTYQLGKKLVFGVVPIKPIHGLPAGSVRVKMRNDDYAYVFVRPPTGGIRKFVIAISSDHHIGEYWCAAFEQGANVKMKGVEI